MCAHCQLRPMVTTHVLPLSKKGKDIRQKLNLKHTNLSQQRCSSESQFPFFLPPTRGPNHLIKQYRKTIEPPNRLRGTQTQHANCNRTFFLTPI
jgi:hypothetical protein